MDKEKIIKLLKEEDEQHFNIEEVDEKDLPLVSVIMPVYRHMATSVLIRSCIPSADST